MIDLADVNEMIFSSKFLNFKKEIKTEEDYQNAIKDKENVNLELKISENSKLFQKEEKNLEEKTKLKEEVKPKPKPKPKKVIKKVVKKPVKPKVSVPKKHENPHKVYQFLNKEYAEIQQKAGREVPQECPHMNMMEGGKPVHYHYICDGCEKQGIVGIRYKCTVCPDFDYCEECEKKFGEKHGHPFLKIRRPEFAPLYIHCHLPGNNP